MTSMIWQRRERIAYIKRQRLHSRAALARPLFFESAVLLLAGCSIGALFGIYGQLLLFIHALTTVTGFPFFFGDRCRPSNRRTHGVLSFSSRRLPSWPCPAISRFACAQRWSGPPRRSRHPAALSARAVIALAGDRVFDRELR